MSGIIVGLAGCFLVYEAIKSVRRISLFITSRKYARQYMEEAKSFIDYSQGLKIVH